jgi:hypothetical protein
METPKNRLKSLVIFRRVMTVPLVSLSALLLVGGPAEAVPAVPGGTTLPLDLGQPCNFEISATTTAKFVADEPIDFDDLPNGPFRAKLPNGVIVVTGPVIATVTNLETGKSITYNISGPGTFDPATNRLSLKGQSLISNDPDISGAGEPFLITTSGNVGFIINELIDEPLRGHISHDVCAELA